MSIVQNRGLAALAKSALAAGAAFSSEGALGFLTAAAVLGAVSSHMPGRYRYYSVFHGEVIGSRQKG